jgi:hypothetical protein
VFRYTNKKELCVCVGVHQRAVVLLRALLHDLAVPHRAHQEQVRHRAGGERRGDALQVR